MRIPSSTRRVHPRHSRNAVAAVEFALVAPVFFLMVFGLLEISRMAMVQHAMTDACREGCRTAVLASTVDVSSVDTSVRNHLEASIGSVAFNTEKTRVTTPETLVGAESESDIVVSVQLDYSDVSWLPFSYFNVEPTLQATGRRRRE